MGVAFGSNSDGQCDVPELPQVGHVRYVEASTPRRGTIVVTLRAAPERQEAAVVCTHMSGHVIAMLKASRHERTGWIRVVLANRLGIHKQMLQLVTHAGTLIVGHDLLAPL